MPNPSGVRRHDYHRDKLIPRYQHLHVYLRGNEEVDLRISGKHSFSMDEGYFKIFDPMGAGVVHLIERGLIGRIEISAVEDGSESR
jgi:hypothetical protein